MPRHAHKVGDPKGYLGMWFLQVSIFCTFSGVGGGGGGVVQKKLLGLFLGGLGELGGEVSGRSWRNGWA
jgi:hypothetical protein